MDAQPKKPEGKIARARVIPRERGTLFAVAYEFEKRFRVAFRVGSEKRAQQIAQDHRQRRRIPEKEIRLADERLTQLTNPER